MKHIVLFLLLSASLRGAYAQSGLDVLLVDDSGDNFGNTELLQAALDSVGASVTYYGAYADNQSPTVEEMNLFDLVIWHTSTWGASLQFWNGNDEDNAALKAYLDQPQARLWVIGSDLFYDRYGAAPDDFGPGDFPYDYMGIARYDAQAYGDDGSQGLPLAAPAPGQPIAGLQSLSWTFDTQWWADAFVGRVGALPVYEMGGPTYVFAGKTTGLYFERSSGARVLTYGFDLSLIDNFDNLRTHVAALTDWWEGSITRSTDTELVGLRGLAFPNPLREVLHLQLSAEEAMSFDVQLLDANGRVVRQLQQDAQLPAHGVHTFTWNLDDRLPAGLYLLRLRSDSGQQLIRLAKQ